MIKRAVLTSRVIKSLAKMPVFVGDKLHAWVELVEEDGLEEVRKIPGYHDEPLNGKLQGMRSIRLSLAYRAYYRVVKGEIEFVQVEGVDKHAY